METEKKKSEKEETDEIGRPLSSYEMIPVIYCSRIARSSSVKQTHTHTQTVPGLPQEQPNNPNRGREESLEAGCKGQTHPHVNCGKRR